MLFRVYVPSNPASTRIDAGSGIVSTDPPAATDGGRIAVDYEGNRYGSSSMRTWADRIHHAAGRCATRYPTIARAVLPADALTRVGSYDDQNGHITLDTTPDGRSDTLELVSAWLGLDRDEVAGELDTVSSSRHLMLREVRDALASGDPATMFAARQMAARYRLPI